MNQVSPLVNPYNGPLNPVQVNFSEQAEISNMTDIRYIFKLFHNQSF